MSTENYKSRKIYLDIIRIFACFMVIINHTLASRDMYGKIAFPKWVVSVTEFALCKTGVTLFLLVSGSLLLTKEESYKIVIKRCFHFVFLAYIWSVIYSEYWSLYYSRKLTSAPIKNNIFTFTYQEGSWHLWYIYLIIGIYLLLPFFRKTICGMKTNDWNYFLLLFFVIGLCVSFFNVLIPEHPIIFHRNFTVPLITSFIAVYLCSVWIDSLPINKRFFFIAITVFTISVAINVIITIKYTKKEGAFSYVFDDATCLPVVFTALSVFYIIKYLSNVISFSRFISNIIHEISDCTFGIYLIHPMVLNTLNLFDWYTLNWASRIQHSLHLTLLFQLGIFIICGIICGIIKRIPILKKTIS